MFNKTFCAGFIFLTTLGFCGEEIGSLQHATVGIYVVDNNTGKVLLDKDSDRSLIPSSCMKVITTAAALHVLGPDFRFKTELQYDGWVDEEKVLHGNIYIRGDGDPCLGSDRIGGDLAWKKQLEIWAQAIEDFGIHTIEGKIIADASKWEKALAVPSWSWEDLGNYYGAGACSLSFHENMYSIFFQPGEKEGQKTKILRVDPPLKTIFFKNEVLTGPIGSGDQACIYGSEFSPIQVIRGTVPAKVSEFSIKGCIPDPVSCCETLLIKELEERGRQVLGKDLKEGKGICLHTTLSPSVQDIVYLCNQNSINLYAEHLLKKMGEVLYQEGSTTAGIKAVKEFLHSRNIDLIGSNIADGSGLSRKNLITAKQFVFILSEIRKTPFFSQFLKTLPKEGEYIWAKSGGMSLIKGFVGYTKDKTFAILINQCAEPKKAKELVKKFFSYLEEAPSD